jgi:hypothetical protein
MTPEETVDILTAAAAFDRRTVGRGDVAAWHAVIGDLDFADAQAAVMAHYRESRDWIMPADVRKLVKAMRRDRLDRAVIPAPGPELADQPGRYKAALDSIVNRIASGRNVARALAAPVRDGAPPKAFTDAQAALRKPLSPQEIAARQAAESRAEREEVHRQEVADGRAS